MSQGEWHSLNACSPHQHHAQLHRRTDTHVVHLGRRCCEKLGGLTLTCCTGRCRLGEGSGALRPLESPPAVAGAAGAPLLPARAANPSVPNSAQPHTHKPGECNALWSQSLYCHACSHITEVAVLHC